MSNFFAIKSNNFAKNYPISILKKGKLSGKHQLNDFVICNSRKNEIKKVNNHTKTLGIHTISSHIRDLSDGLQISVDMTKVRNGHFWGSVTEVHCILVHLVISSLQHYENNPDQDSFTP